LSSEANLVDVLRLPFLVDPSSTASADELKTRIEELEGDLELLKAALEQLETTDRTGRRSDLQFSAWCGSTQASCLHVLSELQEQQGEYKKNNGPFTRNPRVLSSLLHQLFSRVVVKSHQI
jgi:hypothetical protein